MPAPPIDRPGEGIDGPLADQSAVRQYIVRLRGMTDVACENSSSATPLPGADQGRRDKSAPTDGRMIFFICIIGSPTTSHPGLPIYISIFRLPEAR